MAKFCKWLPDKGAGEFLKLQKALGRNKAVEVFGIGLNGRFQNDYEGQLKYNEEGIPTAESLMATDYIQRITGEQGMAQYIEKQFPQYENSQSGNNLALSDAMNFNRTNEHRDKYIALTEKTDAGTRVVIKPRTMETIQQFNNQYGVDRLNTRLAEILAPLGITIGHLTEAEVNAGRVGHIDFSKVQNLAEDFIRVADNPEGQLAVSEEFAHLMVRLLRDHPLIQRAFRTLTDENVKEVLGEEYDTASEYYQQDKDRLKEEAIGQILQGCLLDASYQQKTKAPTLWQRIVSYIKNLFRQITSDDLRTAIEQVRYDLNGIAEDLLKTGTTATTQDIFDLEAKEDLNSLSEVTEKAIDILKNVVIEKEHQRLNESRNADKDTVEKLLQYVMAGAEGKVDAIRCMIMYMHQVQKYLSNADEHYHVGYKANAKKKFQFLRRTGRQIEAYRPILEKMNEWYYEAQKDGSIDLDELKFSEGKIGVITFREILDRTSAALTRLESKWSSEATPAFATFLEPFLGKNLTNPFKKGQKIGRVEDMLRVADEDITFTDLWLDPMADSQDVVLQLFDAAVREKKEGARIEVIDVSKRIQVLAKKAQKQGINDFKWMYKRNKDGNRTDQYITAGAANALGPAYAEFRREFMKIKQELDTDAGMSKVKGHQYKVIQIRKDLIGGKMGLLLQGKFNEFGQAMRDAWYAAPDDVEEFGTGRYEYDEDGNLYEVKVKAKGELKLGLDGKPAKLVPRYYIQNLKSQELVSDDPIGSLIAYAYMAKNYKALNEVVDAIETGGQVLRRRKMRKQANGIEYFEDASTANFQRKFEEWTGSQLYGRYFDDPLLKDEEGNTGPSKKKVFQNIMDYVATLALGFNGLANLANVTNGIAMQNIDAVVGQYFSIKHLAAADAEYAKLLMPCLANFGKAIKDDKLSLLSEMFDLKMEFDKNIAKQYDYQYLRTIFGESAAFILQGAGDHWLYSRTAIGMLKSIEHDFTKEDGTVEKRSLYDCLEIVDIGEGVKKMQFMEGAHVTREERDLITRKIQKVNQRLFGIYNRTDLPAAQRYAVGKMLLQFRKWMKPAYNARFSEARYDVETDEWWEGYYRTTGRFLIDCAKGIKQGQFNLIANWNELSPEARLNICRAATELAQLLALHCVITFHDFGGDDAKNRPWAKKSAEFAARRTYTEIGALTPTLAMPEELLRILKSPMAAVTPLQDCITLMESAFSVEGWTKEIQTGVYKGWSPVERDAFKMVPYGKNLLKPYNIESVTNFYK